MPKKSCCYGCAPPKRRPGCHASCPEYIMERAERTKESEAEKQRRAIDNAFYEQRRQKVEKAMRHRRKGK